MPRKFKQPLFTQRHYEAMAKYIREHNTSDYARMLHADWVLPLFSGDNPAFKPKVFREACKEEMQF